MEKTGKCSKLLPYHIIESAASGDVEAINTVLKHYEGYIVVWVTRKFYDKYGNPHYCIDETLRRKLETKLITKVLAFNVCAKHGTNLASESLAMGFYRQV